MSLLGATLASLVQGQSVQAALGVRFDFASGTMRVWQGAGPLVDGAGNSWSGVGNVGSISGLSLGIGDVAEPLTIELSGLDPVFMARAANQQSELKGRDCAVYLIVFKEDWSLASNPISLRTAQMEKMVTRFDSAQKKVSLTLTAESFMVTRFRSPNSYLTHADQIARYPGDRGLERISGYTGPGRVWVWG